MCLKVCLQKVIIHHYYNMALHWKYHSFIKTVYTNNLTGDCSTLGPCCITKGIIKNRRTLNNSTKSTVCAHTIKRVKNTSFSSSLVFCPELCCASVLAAPKMSNVCLTFQEHQLYSIEMRQSSYPTCESHKEKLKAVTVNMSVRLSSLR